MGYGIFLNWRNRNAQKNGIYAVPNVGVIAPRRMGLNGVDNGMLAMGVLIDFVYWAIAAETIISCMIYTSMAVAHYLI